MKDRAMQALYLLALNPIAETLGDPNSYGYRLRRCVADAWGQCFIALAKSYSPQWVFEGDIESCFDRRIRGWVNFYRCLVSSRAFRALDTNLFWSLWRWARWRHPNKRKRWLKSKYFRRIAGRNWVFAAKTPTRERQRVLFPELEGRWLTLLRASSVPIRRHVKVRAETNPFDPRYDTYLHRRHRTPRSVVVGATA